MLLFSKLILSSIDTLAINFVHHITLDTAKIKIDDVIKFELCFWTLITRFNQKRGILYYCDKSFFINIIITNNMQPSLKLLTDFNYLFHVSFLGFRYHYCHITYTYKIKRRLTFFTFLTETILCRSRNVYHCC